MTAAPQFDEEKLCAVHNLSGVTLKSGWNVKEKVSAKPGSTGGHFSVCYLVEKDGQIAFLKALNILTFLRDMHNNISEAMAEMLNAFNFEKAVMSRCSNKSLTKVSRLLDAGEENVPNFFLANVLYMIFEKAETDVRAHLNFAADVDTAWKLRSLHNVAVGLKQLHGCNISPQDLKPSNVFVFRDKISKIGDLGRALCTDIFGPHSSNMYAGDMSYAPPEFFFGYYANSSEWKDRTCATDFYLLGSIAIFYFTGLTMNALLGRHLTKNTTDFFSGARNYSEVLPYFILAYDDAMLEFKNCLGNLAIPEKAELIATIRTLCSPDPKQRVHNSVKSKTGNKYELDVFVSIFNRIARKAEFKLS